MKKAIPRFVLLCSVFGLLAAIATGQAPWERPALPDAGVPGFVPEISGIDAPKPAVETPSSAEASMTVPADQEKIAAIVRAMESVQGAAEPSSVAEAEPAGAGYPDTKRALLQAVAGLCVVVALILVLFVALRKLGRRNPMLGGGEYAAVVGRVFLDRNVRVHLVRTAGKVLVIGTSGNSVTLLTEFDASLLEKLPARPAGSPPPASADSFLSQLQGNLARMSQADVAPRVEDADIDSIRGEIVRLKQRLEDEPGD